VVLLIAAPSLALGARIAALRPPAAAPSAAGARGPAAGVGGRLYGGSVTSTTAETSRTESRQRLLLAAAIVTTVVAWASAFVVIRGVAPYIGGGSLALGRLLVGVVALAVPLLASRRWVRPSGRDWLLLALYGAGWFGAYNVSLNLAEQTLDAGTTAMLVNIGPILIAVGGALVFREGISRWLAAGLGVAFLGAVLIGIASGAHFGSLAGVLWCITAAVVYTVGVLAQKPVLAGLPNAQVTFLGCAIGAVACLPWSGSLVAEVGHAPASALLGVLWLGLVPTAIAFSTWTYALHRMSPGRLGVSTYVVPPIVILLALAVFGEVPAPLAIVGGAVCLVGVAISRRRPEARARQAVGGHAEAVTEHAER
jgi:drug/metabolite transporter (DMT)-like permease